jgi:hypothetical protein
MGQAGGWQNWAGRDQHHLAVGQPEDKSQIRAGVRRLAFLCACLPACLPTLVSLPSIYLPRVPNIWYQGWSFLCTPHGARPNQGETTAHPLAIWAAIVYVRDK